MRIAERIAAAFFLCLTVVWISCKPDFAIGYVTTADGNHLFEESALDRKGLISDVNISIDSKEVYQEVRGFGAAVTGASCYNLLKLDDGERKDILTELFDVDQGLGISLVRVSIGASDFSVDEEFTWCDEEGIENFRMPREDRDYLIPVLKEIYAINPDVKIIASPWSCPIWMKRRSLHDDTPYPSWTSGSLMPSYYEDYARYFVMWINAMQDLGFDIYAVTMQNEPLNHGNSMSLYMTWQEQRDFLKTALGPAFEEAGLDTRILLFDHNYDYDRITGQLDYVLKILADEDAARYAAGSAWHNYRGSYTELDRVNADAPGKEIYFTEASIGTWNYQFGRSLLSDFNDIFIQTLKRGCMGVTLWNFMLDENRRPYRPGGCGTCYGVLTLGLDPIRVADRTSHYYNIAHASKVVKPGAVRVKSSDSGVEGLDIVVFRNVDRSLAALICNQTDNEHVVRLGSAGPVMDVPANSIASAIWH